MAPEQKFIPGGIAGDFIFSPPYVILAHFYRYVRGCIFHNQAAGFCMPMMAQYFLGETFY
jgi:hypothetical protein